MTRHYARILVAGCAAVVAATLGTATAVAATTWTVRPGGPVSLTSGKFTLKDTTTDVVTTCPSARMTGTLKGGSGLPGTGIGSIAVASFPQCGRGLPPAPVLTPAALPWHVSVTSYNATTGVVTGSVSHVRIRISSAKLSCAGVVDGTGATAKDGLVRFSYTDSTGTLKLLTTGGNLHFYRVMGCAGLFNSGDRAALSAMFTLSPAQTITSP